MARILLLKTFSGHRGRPGMRGGSLPQGAADGRGGGGDGPLAIPFATITGTEITGDTLVDLRASAVQYAKAHFIEGTVPGKSTMMVYKAVPCPVIGAPVRLSRSGIDKTSKNPESAKAVAALPELLRHAVQLREPTVDYKEGRRTVLGAHHLVAALRIGEQEYGVRIVVRAQADGHQYREAFIKELVPAAVNDRRSGPRAKPIPSLKVGEAARTTAQVSDLRELFKDFQPKGEPMAKTMDLADLLALFPILLPPTPLLKAAIPPGARWITVRPNGPGSQGQPVLVQPAENGSMRVIGGAGGKLNYLKLRGVKSEAEYRKSAAERAQTHRDAAREKRQAEKAQGTAPSKAKAREAVQIQHRAARDTFVATVAAAMKWSEADTRFPEEKYQNASASDYAAAMKQHAQQLYQRAREAVQHQRAQILADADRRDQAGLGTVPLEVAPDQADQLSVADLDLTKPRDGLGFNPAYGDRAEKAGLTEAELAAETAVAKGKEPSAPRRETTPTATGPSTETPTEGAGKAKKKAVGEAMGDALDVTREPGPKVDPKARVDAAVAMDLLRAEKRLREAGKAARGRLKEIDTSKVPVEPKAFVIEADDQGLNRSVMRDLEDEAKTLRTRGFLSAVAEAGGAEALGTSVARGSFASVNALALAAGGAALLDRSVVDVLGPAGAAQVLAARLHSDLGAEEFAHAKEAMGRFHVDHYMRVSSDVLAEAKDWQEQASEIALGEAASGADLAVAQELNARRRELAGKARSVLGQALGEMETNAALVAAMENPTRGEVQVSLGSTAVEAAIKQARAIGLERGDYQVERVGPSTLLTIKREGMARLARPVSREDMAAIRQSLDIIEGRHDEDGWLPHGFADRPDIGLDLPAGAAPRLARAFPEGPDDVRQAVADYIGGRMADGDAPAEIIAALQTVEMMDRSGDRQGMMAALDELAPSTDAEGNLLRVETHAKAFEQLADDYVARQFGGTRQPIHKQAVAIDSISADALHRALAQHPEGVAAFKPIGDMTPQDQMALRKVFLAEHGRTDSESKALAEKVAALDAAEPEKERDGLFGPEITPEWTDWRRDRDAAAEAANKAAMTWGRYVGMHGSPAAAYGAVQDVVRGRVLATFAEQHNRLRPDAPLRTGRAVIRGDLQHLDALDPTARAKREEERRALSDELRSRVAGRYAAGGVADRMAAERAATAAAEQAQLGMFGFDEPAAPKGGAGDGAPLPEDTRPLGLGERVTIGHAAERHVASMMQQVGRNFRPGQKVELWKPTMSGRFAGRQRAIKLVEARKRISLAQGVGSGKTSMMQGAYTHLHGQGKAKRGLFLVPSIVQGQFGSEALVALEPGKFNWHAAPGASREERLQHYRDPNTHFSVVTHQAFRDDMLHLAAERDGGTKEEAAARIEAMEPAARADFMRDLMHHHGMDHDFVGVDEGHGLLNREGKADSTLSNVVDAVTHHVPYYVNATADPVKNDASEAFDLLRKMNPTRYTDRDAFMRRNGGADPASRANLRREMALHLYPGRIDSGVKVTRREVSVPLSEEQHAQLADLSRAAGRARIARMEGRVDVAAARTLAPAAFEGVAEGDYETVAKGIHDAIGIAHDTAKKHVIDGGAKTEHVSRLVSERKGHKGVVFARRLDRVEEIAARLQKEGHRVVTITGKDTAKTKAEKLRAYKGGAHDIVVASDAGAVGANMQAGRFLIQYDTPMTAMVHAQRGGRIDRVGQQNEVELMDLVADHPDERKNRDRLARKYDLREAMTTPMEGLDDGGLAGMLQAVRAGKADQEEQHFPPPPPEPSHQSEPEEQTGLF